MLRFITILIGCSLTFAVGVQAEQENPKKKPVQKSKPVQKQQVTPKQHTATNKHVQGVNTQHKVNTIPNNVKIHDSNVSKQKVNTLPAVQSGKVKTVGSNKLVPAVQKNKVPAVQADKVHAVGSNKLVPAVQPKNLPAVQSNVTAIQANKKLAAQNLQSALQQQGYYHGEVDGLLGPLTREALANYQRDQGLYATETIDQPTLESLGLG